MKRIFLISVIFMLAVSYGHSQTYYYKAVAQYDKDGAKTKRTGGIYVTFIRSNSICYQSDENGNRAVGYAGITSLNYYFQKTQNGTNVYESKKTNYSPWRGMTEDWTGDFYYFSSDFNQLIEDNHSFGIEYRIEYKRTNGPEDNNDDIPTF